MKRYVTTVGAGLSLLIGVSGALVLFPNVVGARTTQAVAGDRVMVVSHAHTALLSSVRIANRDLRGSSNVRAAIHTNQQRGTMARQSYGIAGQRVRSAVVGSSIVPGQYTGIVRSGIRYGTLYRTGRSGVYRGRIQTATGRTGHKCTNM